MNTPLTDFCIGPTSHGPFIGQIYLHPTIFFKMSYLYIFPQIFINIHGRVHEGERGSAIAVIRFAVNGSVSS